MSLITASCGHLVSEVDDLFDLQLRDINVHGENCITYGVYCKDCADAYQESGSIIRNKSDESQWLGQSIVHNLSLYDTALQLISHSDINVVKFAHDVCEYIKKMESSKNVVIRVNTDNAFTLFIDDSNITGSGKVQFANVNDAIMALNSAKISWVRPIKAHTPDGLYLINEDDFDHCSFFIRMCHDAAIALNDGDMKYIKVDGVYSLMIEVI